MDIDLSKSIVKYVDEKKHHNHGHHDMEYDGRDIGHLRRGHDF